ncbi:MAG TPA: IS21 family transposase [Acetobacteraceae bacterium]|nr:IS21 family transposase [Acetobacteraceae bacterium]
MIKVEDWAEIRRLYRAEGLPIKQIARVMKVSRNTVRAALRSDGPPRYERAPRGSVADAFEPRIRELLQAYPTMAASAIGDRIGWPYSDRTLRTRVAELRPVYLPPDPASRTSYAAGELAQDDFWFPDITVPVGYGQVRTAKQLPVLTMVSGYSRWAGAVLVPTRSAEDLFAGWWQLIGALGAVPRLLVWDGEGAIGRHPDKLTAECQAFRGTLGTRVYVCRPADPEAKGLVERFHDYLERSFLPGRAFASPADFNAQLAGWAATVNTRWRRHLRCAPADRIAADRAAMIGLPPVAPATGWHRTARLPRDHYVRLDGNDYSVDPAVIGRRIEVAAGLDRVRVTCEGRVVADHERCWARHQTISDPAHVAAAKALRAARRLAAVPVPRGDEVEQRDLAVYDAAFGGQGVA